MKKIAFAVLLLVLMFFFNSLQANEEDIYYTEISIEQIVETKDDATPDNLQEIISYNTPIYCLACVRNALFTCENIYTSRVHIRPKKPPRIA